MDEPREGRRRSQVSRRGFIKGLGAGVAGSSVLAGAGAGVVGLQPQPAAADHHGGSTGYVSIKLNINGVNRKIKVEPRTTLNTALRYNMPAGQELTGAKPACDRGACGACTVMVNGRTVYSCSVLAMDCQGKTVVTVEGLAPAGDLNLAQRHMMERDGFQCGFCTPGFIVSITDLLNTNPNPTLAEVKTGLAGNTCRCGAYPRIFAATLDAAKEQRGG